jgi:hypothetical protein
MVREHVLTRRIRSPGRDEVRRPERQRLKLLRDFETIR